jgi:hypothetical protein
MNHIGSRPLLLCTSARSRDERRKPAQPPWCTVGCHPVPQKYRWADAATSAQLSDTTAHARARGVTLPKTSNLIGKDKPRVVTAGYHPVPVPVASATLGHPVTMRMARLAYLGARTALAGLLDVRSRPALLAGWLAGLPARAGDLIFAANDREALWRGWEIHRRHVGLGRRYRDSRFDMLTRCSHCRGIGTIAATSPCAPCSGTGRISLDRPPLAHDG